MSTIDKIFLLLKKQKKTQKGLTDYLGIEKSVSSQWKNGKSLSYMKYIDKIAEFLDTSPSEILERPHYGQRLIEARNYNGKDQKTLAEETGISVSKLAEFENDVTEPTMEELTAIAQAYGLPLSELLWKNFEEIKAPEPSNAFVLPQAKIRIIPVFESVSAGFGAYADDRIIDYIPICIRSDEEAKNTLCIIVQGDSMYPKIENGDIVQVLRQDWAENGQIAVVLLDGETGLVKKFEADKNMIRLISINPEYPPKEFTGIERTRIRILGVVKRIIKEV